MALFPGLAAMSLRFRTNYNLVTDEENSVHFRMSGYESVCNLPSAIAANLDNGGGSDVRCVNITMIADCLEYVHELMAAPECDGGSFRDDRKMGCAEMVRKIFLKIYSNNSTSGQLK